MALPPLRSVDEMSAFAARRRFKIRSRSTWEAVAKERLAAFAPFSAITFG